MKSADEWQHQIPRGLNMGEMQVSETQLATFIRAIQADALRHASSVVGLHVGLPLKEFRNSVQLQFLNEAAALKGKP